MICINMEEKKKIILAYPKMEADAKGMSLQPPLSLLYLAAVLRDKYEVVIYDHRIDTEERFLQLLSEKPLCVGVSSFTGKQIKYALQLAQQAKDAGCVTVLGGIHASLHPEQSNEDPRFDYTVAGDGEIVFQSLLEGLTKGKELSKVLHSCDFDAVNLNDIGPLPYELVDVENYVSVAALPGRSLPFLFSRGCPFKCTFCCNPALNKSLGWRAMSIDKAIKQLDELVEKYELDGIFFHDENLSVNIKLLNELADRIDNRFKWAIQARADGLLRADLPYLASKGLYHLGIGIESGSPKILREIKKEETVEEFMEVNRRLAGTSIEVWYNYMTGFPNETHEDIRMTVNLALQLLDDNPRAMNNTFYTLAPYPGTEIGRLYEDRMPDSLEGWIDFDRHNYNAPWHPQETRDLLKRVTISSKFVGRRFSKHFSNRSLHELVADLTKKWREFDFYDQNEWNVLEKRCWAVLKELFGDNAY